LCVTKSTTLSPRASPLLNYLPSFHRLNFDPAHAIEQPWRVLTVALVHAQPSPFHLLANMIGLFFFGTFVERALGHWRFLTVYLIGTVGGSAMVLLLAEPFSRDWVTNHIGASGAVVAIIGVLLVPTRRLDRNLTGVVAFVALNFGYGFLVEGVSWQSHLGGLITGFVLGCAALLVPRRHDGAGSAGIRGTGPVRTVASTAIFAAASAGLLVLMLAAGAWRLVGAGH